ncbi:MAG: diguanylate cyclase [Methylomonas sp.]|nr:MAG: diguanylate cyclase [Methylomonas sp.]
MTIPHYRWQDIFSMVLIAAAYALLGKLVLTYFSAAGNVTLVWFPGGMALAILLINGLRWWPGIFVGAFIAGMWVDNAFWLCFFIAIGNTLESVLAAWWLKRKAIFSANLDQPYDLQWLTWVGFCCSLISGTLGPLVLWQHGFFPASALPDVILHWWMADMFGIITVTPLVLIWRIWPKNWFIKSRLPETLVFILTTVLVALVVFLDFLQAEIGDLPHGYWMFALIFWAALRFGRHGVQFVVAITAVTALMGAARGLGYFANDFEKTGLWNYWFFQILFSWIGTVITLTLYNERRANARLSASEKRLQAIIDSSPVAYALNDDQQHFTLLNPAFIEKFGYDLADVPTLSDWWLKAYPDSEYRQWVQTTWRQRLLQSEATGQPFQNFEVDICCKNGETKQVLVVSGQLGVGCSDEHLMTLLDVTEQIRANQALSNTNVLLTSILETLPLRVFWKDKQLRYLGANQLFATDAGLASVTDLIAKDDQQLGRFQQADHDQKVDRQVMETGESQLNVEEPLTNPEGETIWLRTSRLPLRNSEAQVIGVVGMYEDITMRKRIEDQLLWRTTFLETLLEASPNGIMAVDKEGHKLLQNHRVAELWGIPDEVAGNTNDSVQLEFVKKRLIDPDAFLEKVEYLYAHLDAISRDEIALQGGVILDRYSSPVVNRLGHYYGRIWQFTDVTDVRNAQRNLQLKESYQRALLDNFPFLVWMKDKDCRYLAINQVFADNFGIGVQEVTGKTDFDFFPDDIARGFRSQDQDVMTNKQRLNIEETVHVLSAPIWMEVYKTPLLDEDGQVLGTVGFARDISDRKQSEELLKLAALVFENSSEAMLVTDAENKILNVNPAFEVMTGFSREEILGKDPKVLASGEHDAAFYQAMWLALQNTGCWQGEIKNRRKSGDVYIQNVVINTIQAADSMLTRRVALFSDITQRKRSEAQIWLQANFDPLTGLPNRHMVRERLAQEIKQAHRGVQRFGLLMIDLDRFKEVNDTLWHEMGDELLQQAATRLRACVREVDTVGRLGGDEFVVILSDLATDESPETVARKLLEHLSQPFTLLNEQVFVSASIGITLFPCDGRELSQLLRNADQAMYAAKNKGRNCYSFFTPSMQAELNARAAMINDLRGALLRNEFNLFYQPIVDLVTGKIYKAEALLRWKHPKRGLVSPAEFVPLAEQSGLINDIGDWVFHSAVAQVVHWRQTLHEDFQISINKSPMQFLDVSHDPADWVNYLRSKELSGQALVVEITEGLLLEASPKTAEHLLVFRDAGIQVAIDDFGTGYSALSYLKKFDIDYLKIDQSFVRNLRADSSDFVLCEAIIVMAHKLGLKVIAEGVETALQCDLLASIKCDYAQGYLFAKPQTAEEFERQFANT